MEPFVRYTGIAVPLPRPNVDTDQIIPKQFLKRIERTGFGAYLFNDWRSLPDGQPNPEFELNNPAYVGAGILIAGRNFGCGSSREHAVWALHDYGIRAIIAPSFADIFYNNSLGNGLLPVVLPEAEVETLLARARQPLTLTVDLEACRVHGDGIDYPFSLDEFSRYRLLNGLDDIGLTLQHEEDIRRFEQQSA